MAAPEWSVVKNLSSSSMRVNFDEEEHKRVMMLVSQHEPRITNIHGIQALWREIPDDYHCWVLLRSIRKIQTAEELLSLMNAMELNGQQELAIVRIYYIAKFLAFFNHNEDCDKALCTDWVISQLKRAPEIPTMDDAVLLEILNSSDPRVMETITSFKSLVILVITLWDQRESYNESEKGYLRQCEQWVDLITIADHIEANAIPHEIIRTTDDLIKVMKLLAKKPRFDLMVEYASVIEDSEVLYWLMKHYLARPYRDDMVHLYYASCFIRYFELESIETREQGTLRVIQWLASNEVRQLDSMFHRSSPSEIQPVPFCVLLDKNGQDSFQSVDDAHDVVGLLLRLWMRRDDLSDQLRQAVMECNQFANLDHIKAFLPAINMKQKLEMTIQRRPLGELETKHQRNAKDLLSRLLSVLEEGSMIGVSDILSQCQRMMELLNTPLLVARDTVTPCFVELARMDSYGVSILDRFKHYLECYRQLNHAAVSDESLKSLLDQLPKDVLLVVSPRAKEHLIWHALSTPLSEWSESFIRVFYTFCHSNTGQLYSQKLEAQLIWMVTSAAFERRMLDRVKAEPEAWFVPISDSGNHTESYRLK